MWKMVFYIVNLLYLCHKFETRVSLGVCFGVKTAKNSTFLNSIHHFRLKNLDLGQKSEFRPKKLNPEFYF